MASRALRLVTVAEFLRMDFGPDLKAELDRGVIRMMASGTAAHARIQRNIIRYFGTVLRGSGCSAYGSDMAVRIDAAMSLRYPDIAIFCGKDSPEFDQTMAFDDPIVICEVLSGSIATFDQETKLDEYKSLASVETVCFIDPERQRVRVVQRTGKVAWTDAWLDEGEDIMLPRFALNLPQSEIFARD
jgi:Uma2 family endonuclease